jgi:hypothetical protein
MSNTGAEGGGQIMAIGIRMKIPGVTQEQFDAMAARIRAEPIDGLLFHASGPVDGGWEVINFWESRAHFLKFIADRVLPAMGSDVGGSPEIHQFPVHEYLRP